MQSYSEHSPYSRNRKVRQIHLQYEKVVFDVEITLNDPFKKLQETVYKKTGVPVSKQKIIYRGKMITKQTELVTLLIKDVK